MSLIPQAYAQTIGIPQPTGMQITDIGKLISSVISLAFIIAGILVFAFLVWGGIEWITSGGDKTKTEQARNRITNALVGLAIVAASYAVMRLISYFFGVNVLDAGTTIPRPF
ncbi:MAG: hypothetical protein UW35_C0035G0004 [Candidatus Collierbacteria bacterium GW2011_GWF2_44_15]|uniref:Uncharacterized protein n=5 Tax=Patescibacteria group TaxID=1783273 RepID=A0A0G1KCQ1_9BACT|nr:MAG: hypothetical protein UR19_C0009G0004 [Candidatus Nomurabacteria bacterium GW2011_GWF1_31_48]KKT34767.1 MAG: hypothetical protein UW23_C0029G0010 [Candidatus Collierbacteria bacterium GW2011_GWA1_44_12]KKT45559.1 MAG: hypothetical protein UW35_C0035G0004 [Candidatus Collierbacteria bacterium GW2011_GWF2_44_15]KKT97277.1 MAG: hypothetical protein UW99_C0036G0004 [Candidatus Collierbacteria bacterium GW2011_GWC2_45_15]KKU30188.1 MAG: hypothetical protein UX41_C0008G0003 [Candidatus Collier